MGDGSEGIGSDIWIACHYVGVTVVSDGQYCFQD